MWQSEFRKFIVDYSEAKKISSKYFSYRKLSKKLSMSISTMSMIINGSRKISPKKAKATLLKIDDYLPTERDHLIKKIEASEGTRQHIEPDLYEMVLSWQSLGIYCALELGGNWTVNKISQNFQLPAEVVQMRLESLLKAKFIKYDSKNKTYSQLTYPALKTTDQVPSASIKKAHAESFAKITESLETVAIEERDFAKIIVTGDSKKIKQIQKLSRQFLNKAVQDLESSTMDQVYQISVQMIPLLNKNQKTNG